SKLRVSGFTVSIDGYGAGPGQDLKNPLGIGGFGLHTWLRDSRTFHDMIGQPGGETGVDDDFAARANLNVGAWILGRNMFGPIRGPWPDETWRGWWGESPPYHTDVFVLTHHARAPLAMEGGTTFYFITDGIHAALERARSSAAGKDVRVGGGAATIRAYLQAALVDELHLDQSPVLLGSGEHLFNGIDLPALGYRITERVTTPKAMHLVLTR
ncbi:MAG TPA: dihydrofolate reductase family protein, partial [Polyangiales bacterium]|nr:dihydrofolate reductase family protein [Polyangiales bacterium]